jgi:hypothetical protein
MHEQRQPDHRRYVVAPHERAVHIGGRVLGDQRLLDHRQPHRGAVLADVEVVRRLSLCPVGVVPAELLGLVGEGRDHAVVGQPQHEGGEVGTGGVVEQAERDDVGAGGALKIVGQLAQESGETGGLILDGASHC